MYGGAFGGISGGCIELWTYQSSDSLPVFVQKRDRSLELQTPRIKSRLSSRVFTGLNAKCAFCKPKKGALLQNGMQMVLFGESMLRTQYIHLQTHIAPSHESQNS